MAITLFERKIRRKVNFLKEGVVLTVRSPPDREENHPFSIEKS